MSAEGPNQGPSADKSKTSTFGIGGIVRRMKSVLRRESSKKKEMSVSFPAHGEKPEAEEQTPASPKGEASPSPPEFEPVTPPEEQLGPESGFKSTRQALFEERARTLFAKYDLQVEPHWIPLSPTVNPSATVERVHKPIRIRVHRYCHRCDTVFGPDRVCASCDHKRCKKCPRYPSEKEGATGAEELPEKGKSHEGGARSKSREPLLVIQGRNAGQILVHQPVVQRVRRTCHKCDAQFLPSSSPICSSCGHLRCTRCPRNPAKPGKWESGYPGDAPPSSEEEENQQQMRRQERVFRKPRQRVRWHCERCTTLFVEGSKTCRGCGHQRCGNCVRQPPKKNKDTFDPDVVSALQEKLSALVVTTSAS